MHGKKGHALAVRYLDSRGEYDARRHTAFPDERDLPSELCRKALHNVGAQPFQLIRARGEADTVVRDGQRVMVCGVQIEPDRNRPPLPSTKPMFYRISYCLIEEQRQSH